MKLNIQTLFLILVLYTGNAFSQACILVGDSCNGGLLFCGPFELSRGIYRVPYVDGTLVTITNDHYNHCPRGRIDMVGIVNPDNEYHVAAAGDGWIRAIVDNLNTMCDCQISSCSNNYIWIEHANGEWTKYTHMKQNSVTNLGHFIGEFVTAGTYLGKEGNVGCASGQHLHFEVAQPIGTNTLWFTPNGGYIDSVAALGLAKNVIPVICGISTNVFREGETYFALDCPGDCDESMPSGSQTISPAEYEVVLDDDNISNGNNYTIEGFGAGLFQAASFVTLVPGFESHFNSEFTARIGECDESPLKSNDDASESEDDIPEKHELKLFPNPASDLITVEWFACEESAYFLIVKDLAGRQLWQQKGDQQLNGIMNQSIDISGFTNGVYFAEIQSGGGSVTQKFIVAH